MSSLRTSTVSASLRLTVAVLLPLSRGDRRGTQCVLANEDRAEETQNGDRGADRRAWFHGYAAARDSGLVELLYLSETASECQGTNRYCCAAVGDCPEAA